MGVRYVDRSGATGPFAKTEHGAIQLYLEHCVPGSVAFVAAAAEAARVEALFQAKRRQFKAAVRAAKAQKGGKI